jgi:L-lysine 6-oxidase
MATRKQAYSYKVEPSIGLARVGDSVTDFYLAPETIGGRPTDCDDFGNAKLVDGKPVPVKQYKDIEGRVKRQGARFRVMRYALGAGANEGTEVNLGDADIRSIEWTVHVANKKAAWYNFDELLGNLYYNGNYDPTNSYTAKGVGFRNPSVPSVPEAGRKALIIDPGPRTLSGPNEEVFFSRNTIPIGYPGSFPPEGLSQGYSIETLGSAVTNDAGHLVVIGAYGRAGGDEPISSYGGADTWYDDIADGTVTCKLTLESGEVLERDAWVIIGSPKFAPELVNITTLDDILYDVGVRYHGMTPLMYNFNTKTYNPEYVVSY